LKPCPDEEGIVVNGQIAGVYIEQRRTVLEMDIALNAQGLDYWRDQGSSPA